MRSLRTLLRLPATLAGLLLLASCHSGASTTKTIGVTLLTRQDEFYQRLEAGLRQAAAAHGYKLIVTSGDFDLAKQQSQIDNFIVQHVDAIVICPVDTRGIGPAIEKANSVKIPVFTADIAAEGGLVVSHIASDNVAGGQLAARYLAEAIGEKGEVGIIAEPEVQSTIDREAGFRSAMKSYPGITVVASLNGEGKRDRSLKAADDMLQAHPNLRGIFAINDESALGALSSAQSRHRDSLVIIGYDASPEAQKAIAGHTQLRADVAQQPDVIGEKTIAAIAANFEGKPPVSRVAVPVRIVDADSVRAMAQTTSH
ncbi:MAG TPA: substrate-binding domain-containing protein [Gemmatimonadales bacterium]|nr:substrate-binding domain-containing protein [Gemmatimonadales bacterium]